MDSSKVLKEGLLNKRQRGRDPSPIKIRGLRFQRRQCRLTPTQLEYCDPKRNVLKGSYPIENIRLIEAIPTTTFHKDNGFMFGDEDEVMYFIANSAQDREEWMKAIAKAALDRGNQMLPFYHTGAFGLRQRGRWNCCSKNHQRAPGCTPVIGSPIASLSSVGKGRTVIVPVEVYDIGDDPASMSSHTSFEHTTEASSSRYRYSETIGLSTSLPILDSPMADAHAPRRPDSTPYDEFRAQKSAAVFIAVDNGDYKEVKDLLKNGGDPNRFDGLHRRTLLHIAAKHGSTSIVELLLNHGANANLTDNRGNSPLGGACRCGHLATVEVLVNSGRADVDHMGEDERTPLHEAAEAGHVNIVQWLIAKGADTVARDTNDHTPYDLAFQKGWKQVMQTLQEAMPEGVRPYELITSHPLPEVLTAIAFCGEHFIVGGSKDNNVRVWHMPDFTQMKVITVPNTAVSVDAWNHFLAISSTSIQVFEVNLAPEKWRTIVVADHEVLENPSLHYVAFDSIGQLVSASVEGLDIKVWNPPPTECNIIRPPCVQNFHPGTGPGCICSLSVSTNPDSPLIAVGVQPGKQFSPQGNKTVYLFDLNNEKRIFKPIDTGHGGLTVSLHTAFSPDGQFLAIGCKTDLGIWEISTQTFLCKPTIDATICALCYSPSGEEQHLAVGLTNGEIKIYEVQAEFGAISPLFSLTKPGGLAQVTCMAYSNDGKTFIVANQSGVLLIWSAHTGRLLHST